jgi:hypothetical protein
MRQTSSGVRYAIWILFWGQIAVFVAILLPMFVPTVRPLLRPAFLPLAGVWLLLGLGLLVLTVRTDLPRLLRWFLLATASSSSGAVLSMVLHNGMYAVGTVTGDRPVLQQTTSALEVVFFFGATIIFPLVFVAGVVGTIVTIIRSRQTPGHPPRVGSATRTEQGGFGISRQKANPRAYLPLVKGRLGGT